MNQHRLIEHETFHLFDLGDLEDKEYQDNLMYHLADTPSGKTGSKLTESQRIESITYLLGFPRLDQFIDNLYPQIDLENQPTGVKGKLLDELPNNDTYKYDKEKAKRAGIE